MQNNINNVSFQANVKPLVKIKNKSAFVEVRNIFREGTKKYPNDNMYITGTSLKEHSLHLSERANNHLYSQEEIYTKNIDEQIETAGVQKFANKLIQSFNALKRQNETKNKLSFINRELSRLENILQININCARNWAQEGKLSIAHRYEVLANNNEGKIKRISDEKNKLIQEYNKLVENDGKIYPEINQLKIFNV